MAFPDGFVEEVRRTADIVRLVSDHVGLRKMGNSWKGLCPFHQEKSPSFNVRSEPPLFHCFGCGEGGDVFKFVMMHERVGFPEAIEIVARRFGVPIPERRSELGPDRQEREQILKAMEAAAAHYRANFWAASGSPARDYLFGRGFQKETLEKIGAGAARDAWGDLFDVLKAKFSPALLGKAGLVSEKQSGNGFYDRFRHRAIFPIFNEAGKVIAFGARSLDGSEPKYLNSPETPVYQKSRTLYGLSWARDAMRKESRAVLMEGYLDVARALEHGVAEAVATCGTALTPAHARLLRRFTERVVVNFDQDDAGQKAARKSIDLLVEEGLAVFVVQLPQGHDPDTYLREHGGEAYRKRLDEALPYMEWLIQRAAQEHDTRTPAGKAAYLNALLPTLAGIASAVERAAWVPRIAERGRLDSRATLQELRRAVETRTTTVSAKTLEEARPAPAPASAKLLPAERMLMALLLTEDERAAPLLADLGDSDLEGLRSGGVLRAAREMYEAGARVDAASLASRLEGDDARLVTELAVDGLMAELGPREGGPERLVDAGDCLRELKRRPLEARLKEIRRALQSRPDDALLAEHTQLVQQMKSL